MKKAKNMNIIIKKNIDLTPALETYLQKKFAALEKLVTAINKTNPAELTIEVGRTTNHHRKGDVYRAAAKLHLGESHAPRGRRSREYPHRHRRGKRYASRRNRKI